MVAGSSPALSTEWTDSSGGRALDKNVIRHKVTNSKTYNSNFLNCKVKCNLIKLLTAKHTIHNWKNSNLIRFPTAKH